MKRQHFSGRLNIIIICRGSAQEGGRRGLILIPVSSIRSTKELQNRNPSPASLSDQTGLAELSEVIMHIISPPSQSATSSHLQPGQSELFFISLGFSFPKNINLENEDMKSRYSVILSRGILTCYQNNTGSASMISKVESGIMIFPRLLISQPEISIRRKEPT